MRSGFVGGGKSMPRALAWVKPKGAEQEGRRAAGADAYRPEPDRAGEHVVFVARDEAETCDRIDALAQPVGAERGPARREAEVVEILDLGLVVRLFGADAEHGRGVRDAGESEGAPSTAP